MPTLRYLAPFAIVSFLLVSLATLTLVAASYAPHPPEWPPLGSSPLKSHRPNIIFILVDDQDLHMNSLSYMPHVKKHLLDEGTFFKRHFCTVSLCCPSRVSMWTGKAAHNTNVTSVTPPYGGYPKFISQGLNKAYLPVWLQEAGYNTYYTGKLFNGHGIHTYNKPFPAGFNGSDFLIDPFTYDYLNPMFQRNKDKPIKHKNEYSTDLVTKKAYGFLHDASMSERPFFLAIAPISPHSNARGDKKFRFEPPVPAKRHEHLFKGLTVPRTPNFNPEEPSSVSWIRKLPRQGPKNVAYNDDFYRSRIQALQSVDEMVDNIVSHMPKDLLDNTYIIYTSDNGYHIGQHRLQPGKECGFEEDINVPLIIRGPNVPVNEVTEIVTTHTDVVPTIFSIIGATNRKDFDGSAIPLSKGTIDLAKTTRQEHVNVEYWGWSAGEGQYGDWIWNNTYKSLRILGRGYNLYYSVWCNNDHEVYDLDTDPYQTHNLYSSAGMLLNNSIHNVLARLDSLLMVLKSCKGTQCIKPWNVIHPNGDVKDLWDALSVKYDNFYLTEQQRVEFNRCEQGYLLDAEGPQDVKVWTELQ